MSNTITPTVPTFQSQIAVAAFATGAAPGTKTTLDLTTKKGAILYCRIGRAVATALTRAAYIAIRRTVNNTVVNPANNYDFISSITAVNATTVSSGGASASTSMVLGAGTGFAAGQIGFSCLSATDATRAEWFQITDLATATITVDRAFRVSHSASDIVTWGADVGVVPLPGGDVWDITPVNNSGQAVIMAVDAAVFPSDTVT